MNLESAVFLSADDADGADEWVAMPAPEAREDVKLQVNGEGGERVKRRGANGSRKDAKTQRGQGQMPLMVFLGVFAS